MHMRPEIGEKHHGAHVHVRGGDNRSASIDIDTLEMFAGRLSHKEKKEALIVIRDNRSVLLEIWNVLSEGVSINVDYSLGKIQFCEIS